jgi:hypothetical protein
MHEGRGFQSGNSMKRFYYTTALPCHWIVGDEAEVKWIVPAIANGWGYKRLYKGNYTLDECADARINRRILASLGIAP